jgi:hypothetical protein
MGHVGPNPSPRSNMKYLFCSPTQNDEWTICIGKLLQDDVTQEINIEIH